MRKTLIIALLFFVVRHAHAQANTELNTLILGSFTYFPRIKELNKAEELSEMRIEVAQTGYLPAVTGIASYTYLNPISQKEFVVGPNETQLLKFQPYNNYNVNVGVTQLIWDFGKTKAQVEKAKADLLASRQNIESGKLQLASQVAGIYYSMIYLKLAAQVQDSVISSYEVNLRMVEGKIEQGDALQIEAALMRYSTGQSAEPGVDQFDFKTPAAGDLANNPDVLAANERISSARADLKYARTNRLPSLNFQGGAGFRNGYQPDINPNRFNYLAGVTLGVPIFQGGRLNKSYGLASKSMELNELSKATLTSTLLKDLESAQSDLKAYDEQIKNSVGQTDVANETLRLTEVRYKQGVATYLDLINASTNLQRANLNRLQYEYQRTLSQVEMCRLLGVRFWQD